MRDAADAPTVAGPDNPKSCVFRAVRRAGWLAALHPVSVRSSFLPPSMSVPDLTHGDFTLPGEAGYEQLTLRLAKKWGADTIRDSDGMVGLNFAVGFLREDGGPGADVSLDTMVRHVDYLVERLGIERVGLGSDFDGATIPAEIGDVSGLPRLLDALRASGFDDDAMRKVTHENWIRVLRKTWKD